MPAVKIGQATACPRVVRIRYAGGGIDIVQRGVSNVPGVGIAGLEHRIAGEFGAKHGLQRVVNRISPMIPHDQRTSSGQGLEREEVVGGTRGESGIVGGHPPVGVNQIGQPVGRSDLVDLSRRVKMDSARGHPSQFQLRIFPQSGLSIYVPLPGIGGIGVVLQSLLRPASRYNVEGVLARATGHERAIERYFSAGADGKGGIVGVHPEGKAHRITREVLTDTATHHKLGRAEDIPGKTKAWRDKVIVGGHKAAPGSKGRGNF